MSDQPQQPTTPGFERHIQTGIQVLLVAICVWMANTVQSTSIEVATLTERVTTLQSQVRDFQKEAQTARQSDVELEARLLALQTRLDRIEDRLPSR